MGAEQSSVVSVQNAVTLSGACQLTDTAPAEDDSVSEPISAVAVIAAEAVHSSAPSLVITHACENGESSGGL